MFDWVTSFWGMVYLAIGFAVMLVHFSVPIFMNGERFGWWVSDEDSIVSKVFMSIFMFAIIWLLWWAWLIFCIGIMISVRKAKARKEEIFRKHASN